MLYLATDHRGLKLKDQLKLWLQEKKIPFEDLGAHEYKADDDYPDAAARLSKQVLADPNHRGVIFCGSGAGVCIAANKVKGIRCAIGFNPQQVKHFAAFDQVNVLAIAADHTSKFKCFQLVKIFLNTPYSQAERVLRRVGKLE